MAGISAFRGSGVLEPVLAIVLVLVVVYAVPFLVYGALSVVTNITPPGEASPTTFLTSVLVSKLGTAVAFVLIFYLARESLAGQWVAYAFPWWVMFAVGEVGQAIGPDYTREMAIAGIVSETIYFPLAAYVTDWLLAPASV